MDPTIQTITDAARVALHGLRHLDNAIDEITHPDDETDQTQQDRDDRTDLIRHLTRAREALRDLDRTATTIGGAA